MFRRIANDIKARIDSGEFREGQKLPSEGVLADDYGVARVTIRRATRQLEYEQIVEVRHGHGTFVRQRTPPELNDLRPGQRVMGRMPTLEEQQELEIPETTPVLVVVDPDGSAVAFAADRVVLQCPAAPGS